MTWGCPMSTAAQQTRNNRTITVEVRDEATDGLLLGDGKACVECVGAFLLSLGFQLAQKATCQGGGGLRRPAHSLRVRRGGVTLWRSQDPRCRAVCTVLPHFVVRYGQRRPEVARDALVATHGGRRLERCAILWPISPRALSRLGCACGQPSVVTVRTRGGLPLPPSGLADAKHRRGLPAKGYLPTMVRGRVL